MQSSVLSQRGSQWMGGFEIIIQWGQKKFHVKTYNKMEHHPLVHCSWDSLLAVQGNSLYCFDNKDTA